MVCTRAVVFWWCRVSGLFFPDISVEANGRLTSVACPFSEGFSGSLNVVAVDISSSDNCFVKISPALGSGVRGLSVDTAMLQCPKGGKVKASGERGDGHNSGSPREVGRSGG